MKKPVLLLFITCSIMFNFCVTNYTRSVTGVWTEHWIDEKMQVDTLQIKYKSGSLSIECMNENEDNKRQFFDVLFDGKELTFHLILNGKTTSYKLKINEDKEWLIGQAKTWRGEIEEVKLQRIK